MKVKQAKTAGFCFGVKRAIDKVNELLEGGATDVYTLGPLIHNEQVVGELEKKGVSILRSQEELERIERGVVVIRSHGVPRQVYELLEKKGLTYVDMTCPFVKKIHKIADRESAGGRHIVIIGDPTHPEVQGIRGWCRGESTVIETTGQAENFLQRDYNKVCIVSQTTFNYNKFQELVEILAKKRYDRIVLNTICNATEERQSEAAQIAKSVDAMIVIGGKHSSNTQKLFEICDKECKDTYYIQTLDDLDLETFQSTSCVGITAGASTPNNIIEEVSKHVRNEF